MQSQLRPAEASDAGRVAEVLIESRRAFLPFAPSAHTDAEVRRWVRDVLLPGAKTTVAIVDGAVVGVLAASTKDGFGWVEQLFVHPTHVGQGIGSRLLAHMMATTPGPIRLYTFQQNVRSRKFYERHGFIAIEFTDGSGNEERCPDVLYELAVLGVGTFGDSPALCQELLALIRSGRKRGGASLLWAHEAESEPVPRVGDVEVVVDHRAAPCLITRVTEVEVVPYNEVTADFAAREGEGDGSLAYWRRAHWDYFSRECQRLGRTPHESMPVVCCSFEVLTVVPEAGAQTI